MFMKERDFLYYVSMMPFVSLAFGVLIASYFVDERSSWANVSLAGVLVLFTVGFLMAALVRTRRSGVGISKGMYVGMASAVIMVLVQGVLSAYLWVDVMIWVFVAYAFLQIVIFILSMGKKGGEVERTVFHIWSSHHMLCVMIMLGLLKLMRW